MLRTVLFVSLLSATALASEPDRVDPLDMCTNNVATLQAEIAKLNMQITTLKLRTKYKIAETDTVDSDTLIIRRVKKEETKKSVTPPKKETK